MTLLRSAHVTKAQQGKASGQHSAWASCHKHVVCCAAMCCAVMRCVELVLVLGRPAGPARPKLHHQNAALKVNAQ
jgi:hypothetical protein